MNYDPRAYDNRNHPGASGQSTYNARVPLRPPHAQPPHYAHQLPEPSAKAAVFVLGLLSVIFAAFGLILGPIALVLSGKGRREVREGRARKDGMHTAGFVLGIVGTCLGVFALLYFVLVGLFIAASFESEYSSHPKDDSYFSHPYDEPYSTLERRNVLTTTNQIGVVRSDIEELNTYIASYQAIKGYYPSDPWLAAILDDARTDLPRLDPWEGAYSYRVLDVGYELRSHGPDSSPDAQHDDVYYTSKDDTMHEPGNNTEALKPQNQQMPGSEQE